ncbi:hypothetical protein L2E82_25115 [Cichorium intybus]|uniref:Uncharacterized protein n=1 Tax=Cichorium intybus TaxID=13427 RepID=A0ACB9E2Z9_CICIN|nr:hypothetical protein L2E82_25115 [Cichorium intybus]
MLLPLTLDVVIRLLDQISPRNVRLGSLRSDILAALLEPMMIVEVTEALAGAGLESSNLIVGTDFTKCSEWTGRILPLTGAREGIWMSSSSLKSLVPKVWNTPRQEHSTSGAHGMEKNEDGANYEGEKLDDTPHLQQENPVVEMGQSQIGIQNSSPAEGPLQKTPLKEKSQNPINEPVSVLEDRSKGEGTPEKKVSQISPRIIRSKSKRSSSMACNKNSNEDYDSWTEDSISTSGISSMLAEIGEACGFKGGCKQRKGRSASSKAKIGGNNMPK